MDGKRLSFNSMISDYEVINPEFARVKVYVCYAGKNRNGSSISEEVLEEMAKTIYGIPVVAEYDETNNCFKGHGGKLEISDDGIDFVQTTVPYGFVDPKTQIFYEEVTELDGMTKHNYLCCYAYLWYKRYPEVEDVLRNQDNRKIGQSMEISVDNYEFDEDNDAWVIKGGHFSALCMLGVEPCFESASVTSNFSMNDIENAYTEMLETFKKYTLETLAEPLEETEKFEEVEEAEIVEEIEVVEVECTEEEKEEIEEVKCAEEEVEEIVEIECAEEEVEEVAEVECVEEEVEEEIEEIKCSHSDEEYEKINEELICLKASYSDLITEYEELKNKYEILESEIIELREFKKAEEIKAKELELEENIFSKFDELKEVDGYKEIHDLRFELSEKELMLRLKALAFDNNVVIGKKSKKESKQKTKFSLDVGKNVKHSEWDMLNLGKKDR